MGEERQYTTIHPKVNVHVIQTQMNIREGLLAFGEKEMRRSKELRALMPVQKAEMSYDEVKKGAEALFS